MFSPFVFSSGLQTASTLISAAPGGFAGIDVIPPDSGCAVIIVYDSNSSVIAGKRVLGIYIGESGKISTNVALPHLVNASEGVYVDYTSNGLNGSYIVKYAVA